MSQIVTIAGSPSSSAKSTAILEQIHRLLKRQCVHACNVSVRSLPPEALLYGQASHEAIQEAICKVEQADGVIIATPVYKAAYSGALKTFLDVLPQNILQDKIVLPIATGGSPAHLLALEYAVKPVLSALGASHILQGVYITDSQVHFEHGGDLCLDAQIDRRVEESVHFLVRHIRAQAAYAAQNASLYLEQI